MKNLLTKKQRSMLWKDELGDEFLLLKCGEVFENGKDSLKGHFFSPAAPARLQKEGLVLTKWRTGDPLVEVTFKMPGLSHLIHWYGFKRRPRLKGPWLEKAKIRLAHDIIPYNPVSLTNKKGV